MNRRTFLRSASVLLTTAVVGLSGCSGDGRSGTTPSATGSQTITGTVSPTATETSGQTDTRSETPRSTAATESPSASTENPTVEMGVQGGLYFDPIGLFVEPDTTVTWRSIEGNHSATAYAKDNPNSDLYGYEPPRRIPDGAEGWNSGLRHESSEEFTHTFEVEGTYDYFCAPHRNLEMIGRVVVGEPGGPAEKNGNPDGSLPASDRIVSEGAVSFEAFEES